MKKKVRRKFGRNQQKCDDRKKKEEMIKDKTNVDKMIELITIIFRLFNNATLNYILTS